MKYVIILYLCSFSGIDPVCMPGKILGVEFNTYNDCILEGYKYAYTSLDKLDNQQVNKEKLSIKFDCINVHF